MNFTPRASKGRVAELRGLVSDTSRDSSPVSTRARRKLTDEEFSKYENDNISECSTKTSLDTKMSSVLDDEASRSTLGQLDDDDSSRDPHSVTSSPKKLRSSKRTLRKRKGGKRTHSRTPDKVKEVENSDIFETQMSDSNTNLESTLPCEENSLDSELHHLINAMKPSLNCDESSRESSLNRVDPNDRPHDPEKADGIVCGQRENETSNAQISHLNTNSENTTPCEETSCDSNLKHLDNAINPSLTCDQNSRDSGLNQEETNSRSHESEKADSIVSGHLENEAKTLEDAVEDKAVPVNENNLNGSMQIDLEMHKLQQDDSNAKQTADFEDIESNHSHRSCDSTGFVIAEDSNTCSDMGEKATEKSNELNKVVCDLVNAGDNSCDNRTITPKDSAKIPNSCDENSRTSQSLEHSSVKQDTLHDDPMQEESELTFKSCLSKDSDSVSPLQPAENVSKDEGESDNSATLSCPIESPIMSPVTVKVKTEMVEEQVDSDKLQIKSEELEMKTEKQEDTKNELGTTLHNIFNQASENYIL